jgi:hypothetical protein
MPNPPICIRTSDSSFPYDQPILREAVHPDMFSRLQLEICTKIAAQLCTEDVSNLRLVSRHFSSLFHFSGFWASRFREPNNKRYWILAVDRSLNIPSRDWVALYPMTRHFPASTISGVRTRFIINHLLDGVLSLKFPSSYNHKFDCHLKWLSMGPTMHDDPIHVSKVPISSDLSEVSIHLSVRPRMHRRHLTER